MKHHPKTIAAYTHPMPASEQVPDTKPGPYYVSVIDGPQFALLSGPYATHAEALALVQTAQSVLERHHDRAIWYAYGTVRCKPDCTTPGKLQAFGYNLELTVRKVAAVK